MPLHVAIESENEDLMTYLMTETDKQRAYLSEEKIGRSVDV